MTKVGDIYPAKGGIDTKMWLVVSIKERTGSVCVLGLDEEWNIVSAQTYASHAMRHRRLIGHVNIEEIRFAE